MISAKQSSHARCLHLQQIIGFPGQLHCLHGFPFITKAASYSFALSRLSRTREYHVIDIFSVHAPPVRGSEEKLYFLNVFFVSLDDVLQFSNDFLHSLGIRDLSGVHKCEE